MASTVSRRASCSTVLVAALSMVGGLAGSAGSVHAQELQTGHLLEPLVPAGHVRLGFSPGFTSWDTRFGYRVEDGTVVEEEEALGRDLEDPVGFSLFPGLATLQSDLDALTGGSNTPVDLGASSGTVTKNVTRLDFSAHVGVFDWLTVGGTLPWVRTRTAAELLFRPASDANLGLNPALSGDPELQGYLTSLGEAATLAEQRAQELCAQGSGSSCQSAQALAERAGDFSMRAQRMYAQSPFFLVGGTPVAEALVQANAALEAELAAAGLPGLGAPVFAAEVVGADLLSTLADESGVASPLEAEQGLWTAGDLELEATVRLLDGEVRDSGDASPRLAWTLAGGALVRLATGTVDDPDISLDVGSGDGQMDVEGFAYGALRVGSRIGLRAMGRYGVQRSRTLARRIAPHEAVFPPSTATRTVTWTPGAYLDLTLSPRFLVSETLSLAVDWRLYDKDADEYLLPGGDASDPDPALLARETEVTARQVAVGLRYNTLRLWERGETGTPVEVSGRVVHTVSGSGGQTPKSTRVELSLRLFWSLWGG